MVNQLILKISAFWVVLIAVLYQYILKSFIFDTLGLWRSLTPLENFPNVRCEKITELGLEACEHMWLHEPTGYLYMACSNSKGIINWVPAVDRFNASGRSLTDGIAVIDTRGPGPLASRLKWLQVDGFAGINGDGTFNVHGFDIKTDPHTNTLRILLINHRPPLHPITGELLDASKVGANSTIEQFQTIAGSESMHHVRTYSNDAIITPNAVYWVNDHAFIFSNDRSSKVGFRRALDPFLGGGTIGYCDRNRCNIAKTYGSDFSHPNGIIYNDGLVYISSTIQGNIRVLKFGDTQPPTLQEVDTISVPLPIDNLSIDKNGDIFVAAFPRMYKIATAFGAPFTSTVPSTIFKVSRRGSETKKQRKIEGVAGSYDVVKVMEDDGNTLPGSTIAVHDTETGRVFLGGIASPYIAICETR